MKQLGKGSGIRGTLRVREAELFSGVSSAAEVVLSTHSHRLLFGQPKHFGGCVNLGLWHAASLATASSSPASRIRRALRHGAGTCQRFRCALVLSRLLLLAAAKELSMTPSHFLK